MNLANHLRRSIVVTAVATTIAVAVGAAGTAQADSALTVAPSPVTAAHAPPPEGAFLAAASAPTAPRTPTTKAGNATVKLTWRRPSSNGGATINKYAVQRARAGGRWKTIAYPTTRSYTAKVLTNGTKYYFRIRAHNTAGWGPYSTVVKAVPRTVPTAPRSPAATPGNTTVKLAWRRPSSNGGAAINKYAVQRAVAGGPWKTIAYPTTLGYTVKGLTNGTNYYFRIRAHNTAGWSKPSTSVNAVPRSVPTAPRSPTATSGNSTVELKWVAPLSSGAAPVDNYEITRSTNQVNWTSPVTTTKSTHMTGNLTNGTTYYFRVRAHNALGWSAASGVVNAVPRTVPTAPQSPTATAGLYSVYLTWQKPSSTGGAAIDKYSIEHHLYGKEWTTIGETTDLTYKADGLTQIGYQHYFRIRAHNEAGLGAGSTVVEAIALTEPGPPWNLTATPGNGTVELKWFAPYNDGGTPIEKYIVQQAINEGPFTTIGYPTTGSYTATVQPGLSYHYQIYAHNAAGNSAPSAIASVTVPPTVPSAPTNCNAYQLGGNGSDTLRIEWGPPTNWGGAPILFYTIFVWGDPYQPPVMKTSVWSPNTSYDAAMAVGEGGWVAVFAYNKAGGGPACQSVPFYMYP